MIILGDPFEVVDLNVAASPSENPEDGLSTSSKLSDRLFYTMEKVRKIDQEKYKGSKFKGVVLESNMITEQQCRARTSDAFWLSMKNSINPGSNTDYNEYFVHIPEVTGCYPTFDYAQYIKLKETFGYAVGLYWENKSKTKKIKNSQAKARLRSYKKMLTQLRRFPRFYTSHTDAYSSLQNGQICTVEFVDMNSISHGRLLIE